MLKRSDPAGCCGFVNKMRIPQHPDSGGVVSGKILNRQDMETILVIDDDNNVRDTVGLRLEKEGVRPILAADGKAGLQEALTSKPNLILIDLRMPGLPGIEVCKRLRANGINTPLIVLSAIGEEIDKVLLLEIGADDYIVKPFGTRERLARILAALRRVSPDAHKGVAFSAGAEDL